MVHWFFGGWGWCSNCWSNKTTTFYSLMWFFDTHKINNDLLTTSHMSKILKGGKGQTDSTLLVCQMSLTNRSATSWSEVGVCFNQDRRWADWHRGRFIHRNEMRHCLSDRSGHYRGCAAEAWRTETVGNNGPGDWWARWVRPLNRPINLDEALAAPSQIFPSAYFFS